MSKVRLLEKTVTETDPMIWDRLKSFSYREFKKYVEKQKSGINVYTATDFNQDLNAIVSVKGKSLVIEGEKVRGLNLDDIR